MYRRMDSNLFARRRGLYIQTGGCPRREQLDNVFSTWSPLDKLHLTVDVYLVLLHELSQMRETLGSYDALHICG